MNFVAVSEILNVSPEVIAAALAADNLVIALYFSFLFLITAPAKIMESEMVTAKTAIIDNSAATNNGTTSSSSGATNIINNILEGEFVVENSNVVKTTTSSGIETRSEIAKDKTTSTTAPAAPGCPFHSAAEIDGNNGNANKEETVTKPSELEVVKESFEVVVRRKSETVDTNSLSVALSLSLVFVAISNAISAVTGISSMILLSGLTVLGATSFPIFFGKISKAGGVLGVLFMQVRLFLMMIIVWLPYQSTTYH